MMMYYILLRFDILERKNRNENRMRLYVYRINTAIMVVNVNY